MNKGVGIIVVVLNVNKFMFATSRVVIEVEIMYFEFE